MFQFIFKMQMIFNPGMVLQKLDIILLFIFNYDIAKIL